jgi:diguanylate cyclase (GGDEF)-like protein
MKLTIRVLIASLLPILLLLGLLLYQLNSTITLEKESIERENTLKRALVRNRVRTLRSYLETTADILSGSRDTARAMEGSDVSYLFEWGKLFHSDNISMLLFTDRRGIVLSRSTDQYRFSDDLSETLPVSLALEGEKVIGFFYIDDALHLAVARPVLLYDEFPVGTIVVALTLSSGLMDQIVDGSGVGMSLIFENQEYHSSFDFGQVYHRIPIVLNYHPASIFPEEGWINFFENEKVERLNSLRNSFLRAVILIALLLPLFLIITLKHYLRPYSVLLSGLRSLADNQASFGEVRNLFAESITDSRHEASVIAAAVSRFTITMEQSLLKLEQLSTTDQLTGLYNRRYLETVLATESERAERYDSPFSVLIADIDHFKLINDQYGHAEGDVILQEISRSLENSCRSTDIICRWGGEEFLILSPGVELDGAITLAEKLRTAVFSLSFHQRLSISSPNPVGTLSIGVSQFRKKEATGNLLIRADDALYQAKQRGRNRVVAKA